MPTNRIQAMLRFERYLQTIPIFRHWLLLSFFVLLLLSGCRSEETGNVGQSTAVTQENTAVVDGLAASSTPVPTVTKSATLEVMQVGIPTDMPPTSTPSPTAVPTITPIPTPSYPLYQGPPLAKDGLGVQIHIHHEDLHDLIDHLNKLGVGWVKVQVSWKLYQPEPDRYDQERLAELDALVNAAHDNQIEILLSVSKAPEWSRPITELDGPPLDYGLYRDFMTFLGERYQGRVAAYELWNEPNLQREWNGMPLSAADFVWLIEAGADGVRRSDSEAIIVSGAPAVTGINDGIVAIDDRLYFRGMLESGLVKIVDAIGIHPYGWANPPDTSYLDPAPGVPSHNDHPSFFFKDTVADYTVLLEEFDAGSQLWVTEFGWGSFEGILNKEGTPEPPPANAPFMAYVSEQEQAKYILRAFEMGQELDRVGPMFLWNLNFGPLLGTQFSESGYSLLRPDDSSRPSYLSLQAAAKN